MIGESGTKYCFRILNNANTWEEYVIICRHDTNVDGTVEAYLAEPNLEAQELLRDSGLLTRKQHFCLLHTIIYQMFTNYFSVNNYFIGANDLLTEGE